MRLISRPQILLTVQPHSSSPQTLTKVQQSQSQTNPLRRLSQVRRQAVVILPSLSTNSNQSQHRPSQQRTLNSATPSTRNKAQPVRHALDLPTLAIEIGLDLAHLAKFLELACVRWVTNVEQLLHPPGRGCYGTEVRECVEGGFAAVCTLSRVAYAAESERGDGAVEESVVDGCTAGGDLVEN